MKQFLKQWLSTTAALLAAVVVLVLPVPCKADFGGFADDNAPIWQDDANDFDFDYDDGGDDNDGPSGDTGLEDVPLWVIFPVILCVIGLPVIFCGILPKRLEKRRKAENDKAFRDRIAALNRMDSYLMLDPQFSDAALKKHVIWLYCAFQECWMARDLTPVQAWMTPGAYRAFEEKLNVLRQQQATNHVEDIRFLNVLPLGWSQENGLDVMHIGLETSITDYTTSDRSGKVLSGSKKQTQYMTYKWMLVRPTGSVTMPLCNCPGCGADITGLRTGLCPRCGTALMADAVPWQLYGIQKLGQRSEKKR